MRGQYNLTLKRITMKKIKIRYKKENGSPRAFYQSGLVLARKQRQIMLRIVSFLIIQAFLLGNMSWAASELMFRQPSACLSPALQMNNPKIVQACKVFFADKNPEELARGTKTALSELEIKALDTETRKIVDEAIKMYNLMLQEIQSESNEEFTPEQAIESYGKAFITKFPKKIIGPAAGIVVGLGASGKTTFMKMLKAFYEKSKGTVVSLFDHNILPKDERTIDPVTHKTSEDVTKKFQIEQHIAAAHKNIRGKTSYTPLFDFGPPRARLKFVYEQGNVIIQDGSLRATLKKDKTGEYFLYLTSNGKEGGKGTEIQLGDYTVRTSKTAQNEIVLGIGDSKYVVDENRVGLDTVDLMPQEEVDDYLKKNEELHAEAISLKISEHGKPILAYNGKQVQEMQINTLRFEIETNEEENILLINGIRYYVPKNKWENMRLVVGRKWYQLPKGGKIDFLQRFLPGTGILIFEGIGVSASQELNALIDFGYAVWADSDITIWRREKRAEEEEKRKIDVAAVLKMKRQEDAKYVIPWIEQASEIIDNWVRVSSQSIPESLWVRWKHGKLDDSANLNAWLKDLGIDARVLIKRLNTICKEGIEKQLSGKESFEREIIKDDPFPANELYLEKEGDYGMVLLIALAEESFREFKKLYTEVLKPRMGNLMVESAFFDFTELQKKVVVDIDDESLTVRSLGEVLVKKATWMSVESRLIQVFAEKGMDNEAKIKLIKEYLYLFFKHQKSMWKTAAVIDVRPHLHKYSFSLTPDNQGKERIVLNHFKDLTDNSQEYDSGIYKQYLRKSLDLILEHCFDQDLKETLKKAFAELIEKNVPDNAGFDSEYFGKERDKAHQTADPFGLEIMGAQIKDAESLLKNGKKFFIHSHYHRICKYLNLRERQAFLSWILLYGHHAREYSLEMADAALKLYNIVLRDPRALDKNKLQETIARIFDPKKEWEKYTEFSDDISLWQTEPYSPENNDTNSAVFPGRKALPVVSEIAGGLSMINSIEQAI